MDPQEKQRHYEIAEKLLSEQNFSAALLVGVVAAVIAAIAYAVIAGKWDFAYGFAAAGVGIVVGLPMQLAGRGIETKFVVAASVLTIFGCLLGNVFRVVASIAPFSVGAMIEVWRDSRFSELLGQSMSYFSMAEPMFWMVGAFAAGFLVTRPLSRAERLAIGLFKLRD